MTTNQPFEARTLAITHSAPSRYCGNFVICQWQHEDELTVEHEDTGEILATIPGTGAVSQDRAWAILKLIANNTDLYYPAH